MTIKQFRMSISSELKLLKKQTIWIVQDEVCLQPFTTEDITPAYLAWMNDHEITQYTEQQFVRTEYEDVKAFVQQMQSSKTVLYFGIFASGNHIGSIKLGQINSQHQTADISYLIGNKTYWGKGIATAAIRAMTELAFTRLTLEKIAAGVYATNTASISVLEKNGFICEGVRRSQYLSNGQRVDGLIYGKLRTE